MPRNGAGFKTRNFKGHSWGPDLTIEMISGAAAKMDQAVPRQPPIVVCDIAGPKGGDIGHGSHRNGLDADISFPSTQEENTDWPACQRDGTWCAKNAKISAKFDEARFWVFLQSLVCAKGDPVRVMFIEPAIKNHMCSWVKSQGIGLSDRNSCAYKTLRSLKTSESGHYNHVHVRLKCPGNEGCVDQNWDLSKDGTGC
jgi:murein endopeptidase